MNNTSKTKSKRYDEAFQREAVEHWLVRRRQISLKRSGAKHVSFINPSFVS